MQDKVFTTFEGQELNLDDYNLIAAEAARADDLVLAELLRLAPYDGTNVSKGIIPFGYRGLPSAVGIVASPGAGFTVLPFRAVVGSRTLAATSTYDNLTDIRSAVYTSGAAVTLPAGGGTARVHLLYATLLVDVTTSTTALVKDITSAVVAPAPVNSTAKTYVTVGIVSSTAPALPNLPDPPAGGYNIPLAYIRTVAGYTGGAIGTADILDIAPVLPINHRHNVGVANKMHLVAKTNDDISTWATGGSRPTLYMPAGMVGEIKRLIPVNATTFGAGADLPTDFLVDDTTDWRGRVFKCAYQVGNGGSGVTWNTASRSVPMKLAAGNSSTVDSATTRLTVFRADNATDSGVFISGAYIELYVDGSTGFLRAHTAFPFGGFASWFALVWLEASAPFSNA